MNKKLIIIVFLILFLISGGIFLWKNEKKEQPKVDVSSVAIPADIVPPVNVPVFDEAVPPEYIVIKETTEGKIVENTKKGISMKVPEGWEVNKFVVEKDLEIRKFGSEQTIKTELVDGMIIEVYIKDELKIQNIEDLIIKNMGNIPKEMTIEKIGSVSIAKEENKIGQNENSPFFKEDSKVLDIYFIKNKKLYHLSCAVAGTQYENYIKECEDVIKDKIKNEF